MIQQDRSKSIPVERPRRRKPQKNINVTPALHRRWCQLEKRSGLQRSALMERMLTIAEQKPELLFMPDVSGIRAVS